jgi:hypothetical protein
MAASSLGKSAGARLTVTFFAGIDRPDACNAACTRSRLSATALSGRPTIWIPTLPGATITCTSTGTASMPWKATVRTRETMLPLHAPFAGETSTDCRRTQEQFRNK